MPCRLSVLMVVKCHIIFVSSCDRCSSVLSNQYITYTKHLYTYSWTYIFSQQPLWTIQKSKLPYKHRFQVTTLIFGLYMYKTSYKKIVWSDPSTSFNTTKHHDRYHQPPHVSWSLFHVTLQKIEKCEKWVVWAWNGKSERMQSSVWSNFVSEKSEYCVYLTYGGCVGGNVKK